MTEDAIECFDATLLTEIGWIAILIQDEQISKVEIMQKEPALKDQNIPALAQKACKQLEAYFSSARKWPSHRTLNPKGTRFQQKVWRALLAIPVGQTRTYGELAGQLDTGARAVGNACRTNPIPLFIPCHRVVAANGDGGFSGHREGRWMDIKRWLLAHER